MLKHARRDPGTEECLTTSDYPYGGDDVVPYGGDDVVRSGSLSVWPYAPARSAASTVTSSSHIVRTRARLGQRQASERYVEAYSEKESGMWITVAARGRAAARIAPAA